MKRGDKLDILPTELYVRGCMKVYDQSAEGLDLPPGHREEAEAMTRHFAAAFKRAGRRLLRKAKGS